MFKMYNNEENTSFLQKFAIFFVFGLIMIIIIFILRTYFMKSKKNYIQKTKINPLKKNMEDDLQNLKGSDAIRRKMQFSNDIKRLIENECGYGKFKYYPNMDVYYKTLCDNEVIVFTDILAHYNTKISVLNLNRKEFSIYNSHFAYFLKYIGYIYLLINKKKYFDEWIVSCHRFQLLTIEKIKNIIKLQNSRGYRVIDAISVYNATESYKYKISDTIYKIQNEKFLENNKYMLHEMNHKFQDIICSFLELY